MNLDLIPTDERKISDEDFFNSLDLKSKKMEKIKTFLAKGKVDEAKSELVKYFEHRSSPIYYYDYRSLPLKKMVIDTNPYLFQSALGLTGSLKKFCLYVANKLLDNIYVLPGGDKEIFLGKNYESMIHFNFETDQGKKHRSTLDMFVRGQFFESLAIAYHETGNIIYVNKFKELLIKFFETYPLIISDISPSANRFMTVEDRDVMSAGWLALVYSSLLYTRIPYEIPFEHTFEILKRIWFIGIQFRRFDNDFYRPYNHHYFERGLVPYILATLFPEIKDFNDMKEKGASIAERHILEDFNEQGGYNEHSIAYWAGAALGEMTSRAVYLAKINNDKFICKSALDRIDKSFSLLSLIAPEQTNYPSIGDNGGPAIDPILELGMNITDNEFCRKHLLIRHNKDIYNLPLDYANDKTGFVIMRNTYSDKQNYLLMSAKKNCGGTGHNHMDMLSVIINIHGEEIIGEPYTGKLYHSIRMNSNERGYMYNMYSHNSVLCYSQAIAENEKYANQWGVYRPDSPIDIFHSYPEGCYVRAYHSAYTFCKHIREIFFSRNYGFIISDTIERGNRINKPHIQLWNFMKNTIITQLSENAILVTKNKAKALFIWNNISLSIRRNELLYPDFEKNLNELPFVVEAYFKNCSDNKIENASAETKLLILDVSTIENKKIQNNITRIRFPQNNSDAKSVIRIIEDNHKIISK